MMKMVWIPLSFLLVMLALAQADPQTTRPATLSKPVEKGLFTAASFSRIRDYVLAHGDRRTYCQMYNNNPHASLGGVEIFLNPEGGQQNINCDPKLSGFDQIVIATQNERHNIYYHIRLNARTDTLEFSIPSEMSLDDLQKCIQNILADLAEKTEQAASTGAAEAR